MAAATNIQLFTADEARFIATLQPPNRRMGNPYSTESVTRCRIKAVMSALVDMSKSAALCAGMKLGALDFKNLAPWNLGLRSRQCRIE
jgi:hypothetical protein